MPSRSRGKRTSRSARCQGRRSGLSASRTTSRSSGISAPMRWRDHLDLPHRDPCRRDRCLGTHEVPTVLVLPVPGHFLIRRMMLGPVKAEAERRSGTQGHRRPTKSRRGGRASHEPWMRLLIAFVVFCHGFIYVRIGSVLPDPIKEWRGSSWLLGSAVTGERLDNARHRLACHRGHRDDRVRAGHWIRSFRSRMVASSGDHCWRAGDRRICGLLGWTESGCSLKRGVSAP